MFLIFCLINFALNWLTCFFVFVRFFLVHLRLLQANSGILGLYWNRPRPPFQIYSSRTTKHPPLSILIIPKCFTKKPWFGRWKITSFIVQLSLSCDCPSNLVKSTFTKRGGVVGVYAGKFDRAYEISRMWTISRVCTIWHEKIIHSCVDCAVLSGRKNSARSCWNISSTAVSILHQ
jgi:hypothetical protein